MSREQVARLKEMIAARPQNLDIEERRAGFEAMAARTPLPDDLDVEDAVLTAPDGRALPGRWIRAGQGPWPGSLLHLHGGAFTVGGSKSYTEFAGRLSRASGLEVFVLDYPLAPEHPFPAALEDAIAAFAALCDLRPAAPLAMSGDSCGANLALAATQARLAAGARLPGALYLHSAYLDLTHTGESIATRGPRDVFVRPEGMTATAAAYHGEASPSDPRVSPLFGRVEGLPPVYLQVGEEETLYSDSARLARRIEAAGGDVRFEEWPGMIHVWSFFGAMVDEAVEASDAAGAFLKAKLFQS
ncbi:MAG: alpha/beta hydrolase [Oceanicaulis sp.]